MMLLRKVKAHCPSQLMDEYTPEAWAEVLDDVRYEDAKQAVVRICKRPLELGKSRYIEPGHIIGEIRAVRSKRFRDYGTIELPPDVGMDERYSPYMNMMRELIMSGDITRADPLPKSFDEVRARFLATKELTR